MVSCSNLMWLRENIKDWSKYDSELALIKFDLTRKCKFDQNIYFRYQKNNISLKFKSHSKQMNDEHERMSHRNVSSLFYKIVELLKTPQDTTIFMYFIYKHSLCLFLTNLMPIIYFFKFFTNTLISNHYFIKFTW